MSRLKEMRESKKMTLGEVAKKVGVSKPTLFALEKKGIYDIRTAERYAQAFGCPALFLLEWLDKK